MQSGEFGLTIAFMLTFTWAIAISTVSLIKLGRSRRIGKVSEHEYDYILSTEYALKS